MKKALIADLVHYPIEVTGLEKRLLSTPILNRLHRVKQNSTAYLTFPAANHSRFAHSLGVMHIAGQIFHFGVQNASSDALQLFLDGLDAVQTVAAGGYLGASEPGTAVKPFWNKTRRFDNQTIDWNNFVSDASWMNGRPDYHHLGHFSVPRSSRQEWLLALGCQAVRIAAMVHDLGHPPFSHVMEYAMQDALLYEGMNKASDSMKRVNALSAREGRQLHEILTSVLYIELADDLQTSMSAEGSISDAEFFFSSQSLEMAKLLLFSKEQSACICLGDGGHIDRPVFDPKKLSQVYITAATLKASQSAIQSLHDVKASDDIDADRLDYVIRDLHHAGFKSQGLRLGRLLQTFRLTKTENEVVKFLPSVTALRSVEEFFNDRLELYKGVIYHHHVVKTDLLLQLCILSLLNTGKTSDTASDPIAVLGSVNFAWHVFSPGSAGNQISVGTKVRQRIYPFFDDGWLLGILQREHWRLHDKSANTRSSAEVLLLTRLEELLSGKKTYLSLVKRLQDFGQVWFGFAHEMRSSARAILEPLNTTAKRVSSDILNKTNNLTCYLDSASKWDPKDVAQSFNLYESENEALLGPFFSDDLSVAAQNLCSDQKDSLVDVLVTLRKDKSKIPDFDLANSDGSTIKFSKLSHSVAAMQMSARSMPRLFIFAAKKIDNQGLQTLDQKALREKFGLLLARAQVVRIRDELNRIKIEPQSNEIT